MKNYAKRTLKASNGITLIALVITIIVLLILAGISISMLSGDNGILQKATDAKTKTERQSVVEQARTDVLGYQVENKGSYLQKSQLKSVLDNYFNDVPDVDNLPDGEELLNKEFTTLDKYGSYIIKVSEIYDGKLTTETNRTIITFYIDEAPYQAYEGMNFGEWVQSDFNTANFYLADKGWDDLCICSNLSGKTMYRYNPDFEIIYPSTIIMNGYDYYAEWD